MNLEAFLGERQAEWTELDELVNQAGGRVQRLGPDGVRRLGLLYRGAVADLARGRQAFPADPDIRRLEQIVGRARGTLYAASADRGSARAFLLGGYWRDVRERIRLVALAWLLLLGSAALALIWSVHDPAAAAGVIPGALSGGSPHRAIGLGASQSAALSVSIFINNISVTFLTFASGIALGILPAFLLLYNGAILGAVAGLAGSSGHAADVIELVVPHGILELSCIAVSAAAGMRMGWAVVAPGPLSRREALAAEAPRAVMIVLATAPWLAAAGLVEGFVTPHHLPLAAAIGVGVGLAAPYWAGVLWLGRSAPGRPAPGHPSPAAQKRRPALADR